MCRENAAGKKNHKSLLQTCALWGQYDKTALAKNLDSVNIRTRNKLSSAICVKSFYNLARIESAPLIVVWHCLFFKNGPFPASFFLYFRLYNTADSKQMLNKFCRWLDSNRGPLVSEATALPTEPHNHCPVWHFQSGITTTYAFFFN